MALSSVPAGAKSPRKKQKPSGDFDALPEEEQLQLLSDLKAMKKDRIHAYMDQSHLARTGTKNDLIERVAIALREGSIQTASLVDFLDDESMWGKQHVILFRGPASSKTFNPRDWARNDWLQQYLNEKHVGAFLNRRRSIILPPSLELSTITASASTFSVLALQRREGWERVEEMDEEREDAGIEVELRAFKRVVTRGLIRFEWDLSQNLAMLQILQLPAREHYKDARKSFAQLVSTWLPLDRFVEVRLCNAVSSLYAQAKGLNPTIRAHDVEFEGLDGRRLQGRSKTAKQRLEGNPVIDKSLEAMRTSSGLGRHGNFFFLDTPKPREAEEDPDEVHVVVLAGDQNRINFCTPQDEGVVRHVLRRVRTACAATPRPSP